MRIALFIDVMIAGGVQRSTNRLAAELILRGHEVDIVALSAEGRMRSEVTNRARVFDLRANKILKAIFPCFIYLINERPAVIISAMSSANFVSYIVSKFTIGRRILILSQRMGEGILYDKQNSFKHKILQKLMRLSYRRADAVVAVSGGVAKQLQAIPNLKPERVHVIYNPVWSLAIAEKAREPADHPWLSKKGDVPVLLTVARLAREKGLDTLLRAFDLVTQQRDARLIVMGEGPERPMLERIIAEKNLGDRVSLPGFKPNPFSYMARADLFVLSSRDEGFGNVLVEAMACGLPIVSTDCPGGPAEILDGGRYGALVPVDEPGAMAQAIDAMLDTPTNADLLRQRASEFSIAAAADKYLRLAETLIGDRTVSRAAKCA